MHAVKILAPNAQFVPGVAQSVKVKTLPIHDSLQIKAAEYWLKLNEAMGMANCCSRGVAEAKARKVVGMAPRRLLEISGFVSG